MLMLLSSCALASPWVEPAGSVSFGASAWGGASERQFLSGSALGLTGPLCPEPLDGGQRGPYSCVNGGRFAFAAAALDATVGLAPGLALDAKLPALHATFADALGRERATGAGDLRLTLRLGSQVRGIAVAAALGVKAPTGPSALLDRDVPLGDGQWDLLPGVRVGVSDERGWVETWQTLAVRARNGRTGVDPGEEWQGIAAGGLRFAPPAGGVGRAEWLLAARDRDAFGLRHPGRRLLALRAGAFVQPTRSLWLEAGASIPLAGRRWPSAATPYASVWWRALPGR